ncbi:MAG: hypothetical protein Q9184_003899 [Pyrenodesmia sp. 2 TL-2023]
MSGLKRKPSESAPSSATKPAKKQKLPPAPKKLPLSENFVVDSSDEEENIETNGSTLEPAKFYGAKETYKKAGPLSVTPKAAKSPFNLIKRSKDKSPILIPSISGSNTSEESKIHEQTLSRSISASSQPIDQVRNTADREKESAADNETRDQSVSEKESESEEEEAPHNLLRSARDDETDPATDNETPDHSEESEGDEDKASLDPVPPAFSSAPQESPPPYHPPPGFEVATVTSSSEIQDLFSRVNLEGKQIWHITCLASVPIDLIKEIPIQKVASGGPILSYKDSEYGLVTEADVDGIERVLLIPSSSENSYKPASAKISKTLHLQQIVKLPSRPDRAAESVNGVTKTTQTHVKTIRQQPEGLTMRYRPFGDESLSEDSDPVTHFRRPPTPPYASSAKNSTPIQNGDSISPAKAKAHRQFQDSVENIEDSAQHHKETAEERAQRRAEKKQRKGRRSSQIKTPNEADGVRELLVKNKEHPVPKDIEPVEAPGKEKNKNTTEKEARGLMKSTKEEKTGKVHSLNKGRETETRTPKAVKNTPRDLVELEKVKTKRKKRKSEATEEV